MTTINIARRAFFKGGAVSISHHMPWAVSAFVDRCQRCDDCIKACKEAVLKKGDGGFPTVDFGSGACTFCGDCARACPHGALDASQARPWTLRAVVGDGCLSSRGITCRSCGDECAGRAIRFQLRPGGRATPGVDASLCSGCGGCVAICPAGAITIGEAA